jgi:hypothetical protein
MSFLGDVRTELQQRVTIVLHGTVTVIFEMLSIPRRGNTLLGNSIKTYHEVSKNRLNPKHKPRRKEMLDNFEKGRTSLHPHNRRILHLEMFMTLNLRRDFEFQKHYAFHTPLHKSPDKTSHLRM